jgi:hypothetical protein
VKVVALLDETAVLDGVPTHLRLQAKPLPAGNAQARPRP